MVSTKISFLQTVSQKEAYALIQVIMKNTKCIPCMNIITTYESSEGKSSKYKFDKLYLFVRSKLALLQIDFCSGVFPDSILLDTCCFVLSSLAILKVNKFSVLLFKKGFIRAMVTVINNSNVQQNYQ